MKFIFSTSLIEFLSGKNELLVLLTSKKMRFFKLTLTLGLEIQQEKHYFFDNPVVLICKICYGFMGVNTSDLQRPSKVDTYQMEFVP